MNTTIEFSIFKLVKISTFVLNKHFSIFGTNLPKRCISGLKHHHQIQHICVSLSTKFYLNQTICQDQTSLRRVFLFSQTKIEQNRKTQHVLINVGIKFHLTKIVLIFLTKFSIQDRKIEHHHRIQHVRFNLAAKFHFKLVYKYFWSFLTTWHKKSRKNLVYC